jgi:hypothetical protein
MTQGRLTPSRARKAAGSSLTLQSLSLPSAGTPAETEGGGLMSDGTLQRKPYRKRPAIDVARDALADLPRLLLIQAARRDPYAHVREEVAQSILAKCQGRLRLALHHDAQRQAAGSDAGDGVGYRVNAQKQGMGQAQHWAYHPARAQREVVG